MCTSQLQFNSTLQMARRLPDRSLRAAYSRAIAGSRALFNESLSSITGWETEAEAYKAEMDRRWDVYR